MDISDKENMVQQITDILDFVSEAVYVADFETDELLFINKAAQKMAGITGENYRGKKCYEYLMHRNSPCPFCQKLEMTDKPIVRNFVFPENGGVYQLSGKRLNWNQRATHIEYVKDITEKSRADERSEHLQEMIDSMIKYMPGGLCMYSFDGKAITPIMHNKGFYEIFGYSEENKEKVKNETAFLNVHPDDIAELKKAVNPVIANGGRVKHIYRVFNDKKNKYIWLMLEGVSIPQDNATSLMYVNYIDVTETKEAEEKLKYSEGETNRIVDAIEGGVALYKATDSEFITKYYSKGVPKLTGYTLKEYDELIKRNAAELIYYEDRETVIGKVRKLSEKNDTIQVEFRKVHKNGNLIWVRALMKLVGDEDGCPLIHCVFQNITDSVRSRGELEIQRQTMEISLEHSGMLYWEYFKNKKIVHAGKKIRDLFGAHNDVANFPEIAFEKNVVHLDDTEICRKAFRNLDNGSLLEEFEARVRLPKTKKWVWYHFKCTVITDRSGAAVKAVCTAENIDRYKDLEQIFFETLRQNKVFSWKLIFDTKTIVQNNGTLYDIVFYRNDIVDTPDSLIKSGFYHPDDLPKVKALYKRVYKGTAETSEEYRVYNKKLKEYRWMKTSYTPLQNSDGKVESALGSSVDITLEVMKKIKYENMLVMHKNKIGDNVLIWGYCSITQNRVLELHENTGKMLLEQFGNERDSLFKGLSHFIVNNSEKKLYFEIFDRKKLNEDFKDGITDHSLRCLMRFNENDYGIYVQFHVETILIDNELRGFLTVTDITDRVFSEKLTASTVKNNYDFVLAIDIASNSCCHAEGSVCLGPEIVGMKYSDIIDKSLVRYIPEINRETVKNEVSLEAVMRKLAINESFSFGFTMADESGEQRNKELHFNYIDKNKAQFCIACSDITESISEHQKLLHLLTNSVERAGVVDAISGEYTMHTVHSVMNNLLPLTGQSFNQFCEGVLGKPRATDKMMKLSDLLNVEAIVSHLNDSPNGYNITYLLTENSEERIKMMKFFWIDNRHKSFGILRMDITEAEREQEKQKESLVNALNVASEANKAKSDFLSSMSHDIRTPMNAIIGMTELALDNVDDKEQVKDSLKTISSSSYHLLAMINDVLDMGRIESGQMVMAQNYVKHSEEFLGVINRTEALAKTKNLKFEHSFSVKHNRCIGDKVRMNRIIDNLIGNAVKFTPAGGTISLDLKELDLDKPNVGLYQFVVSDTGVGIDRETQRHIFEPFYRNETNDSEKIEGTGLGLSIVKAFLDLCGGTIKIESDVGRGSKFIVNIPLRLSLDSDEKEDGPVGGMRIDTAGLNGISVLLAEDHPVNQKVAKLVLQKAGVKVTIAENGQEALDTFKKSGRDEFEIILMDVRMPVMDGNSAARAIRQCSHPNARTVPIIAMTANAFASDVKESLEAGMNAYLAKPIQPVRLYQEMLDQLKAKKKQ